jgi:hypothetical protein
MSRTRLRNHYAVEAHFRHAGPHGKTAKAMRRKNHMAERADIYTAADWWDAYIAKKDAMSQEITDYQDKGD